MKSFKPVIKHVILLLLVLTLLFFATGGAAFSAGENSSDSGGAKGRFIQGEVLAPADSMEQAQTIAAAYGLTLKSYAYSVAVLAASDPEETVAASHAMAVAAAVDQQARVNMPELSLNMIHELYETAAGHPAKYEYYPSGSETAEEIYLAEISGEEQWHHEFLDSELAWERTKGAGVVIAVLDTGIDINHPKFAGRILENSYNSYTDQIGLAYVMDDHSHGTHVSGIAAASMEGDESVCGIAPQASILAIKINTPNTGSIPSDSWVRGLNYAVENGANIVNMSFGYQYKFGASELEQNAIADAVTQGVVVVCAAGNASNNHAGYPAAYPETIAVSAVTPGGILASFSNYGPEIDIASPGLGIYSTVIGNGYDYKTGTSMASPIVVGVAALIKSLNFAYSSEEIREVLRYTARKVTLEEKSMYYGYGLLNAYTATLWQGDFCSVTYDFNDGLRAPVTTSTAIGATLFFPAYPEREGYVFSGWFSDAGCGSLFDFSTVINEDITLYAGWGIAEPGMFGVEFPDPALCREALNLANRYGANKTPMSILTGYDLELIAECLSLDIGGKYVKTLQGIGYFSALQYLDCRNNMLEELDVSQNTALTELNCSGNRLVELDFYNNRALLKIECSNNLLADINFPQNANLKYLYCNQNKFTELDISGLDSIIWLFCKDNLLTRMDATGRKYMSILDCSNNRLTEIALPDNGLYLYRLNCDINQLTELDLSKNNLISLTLQQNRLKELDLSKQSRLTYVWCNKNRLSKLDISNNPLLYYVGCTNNFLTGVDITKNINLKYFNCQNNYMSTRDDVIGWELIPNLVFNNSQNFGFFPQRKGHIPISPDIEITDKFIDANFLAAVREITGVAEGPIFNYDVYTIETLNVSSKNIADLAGIEYFENISTLSCQNNLLTELDLSKNIELQTLNCSNNLLTVLDISNCTLLRQIVCGYNHLTKLNVTNCSVLNSLNCTYNDMTSPTDVSGWEQTLLRLDISFKFYPQNGQTNAAVPVITKQPESITIGVNETATLSVEAEVSQGELTYQWFSSNGLLVPVPIPGATSSVYDPPTTKVGMLMYACQITNTDSEATGVKTAMIQSSRAMVTVTASINITLPGVILYQPSPRSATVALYDSAGIEKITSADTKEDGSYELKAPAGIYTLKVTKPGYLSYTKYNYDFGGSPEIDPIDISQLAGDVNGDGVVNSIDLTYLLSEFGRTPLLYENADINGNGVVNSEDLTYLLAGFNKRNIEL